MNPCFFQRRWRDPHNWHQGNGTVSEREREFIDVLLSYSEHMNFANSTAELCKAEHKARCTVRVKGAEQTALNSPGSGN